MSFSNPVWLLLLLLIPLLLLALRWQRARARRYAVRFTAVSTLRAAVVAVPVWRRLLPAALLLLALAALVVAVAQPTVTEAVPVKRATIILVTDHSGSMQATDVKPTRLAAAQKAAHTFLGQLPGETLVGVVAFSTTPDTVQPPNTDHSLAGQAIDNQQASGGTATGEALDAALGLARSNSASGPAAIVLLSDGATTLGRNPVSIARQTGKKKIPIYTVALGTSDATIPNPDPFGPPLVVAPDPATLKRIAQVSGGRAFSAQSDEQLKSIYQGLGTSLGHTERHREVGGGFAIAGLLLLVGAAGFAVTGSGRLP